MSKIALPIFMLSLSLGVAGCGPTLPPTEAPKPADPPVPQVAAKSAEPEPDGTPASLAEIARAAYPDADSRHHRRAPIYERYFGALRQADLHLLEIGATSGAAETIWSRYFPNAENWLKSNPPSIPSEQPPPPPARPRAQAGPRRWAKRPINGCAPTSSSARSRRESR